MESLNLYRDIKFNKIALDNITKNEEKTKEIKPESTAHNRRSFVTYIGKVNPNIGEGRTTFEGRNTELYSTDNISGTTIDVERSYINFDDLYITPKTIKGYGVEKDLKDVYLDPMHKSIGDSMFKVFKKRDESKPERKGEYWTALDIFNEGNVYNGIKINAPTGTNPENVYITRADKKDKPEDKSITSIEYDVEEFSRTGHHHLLSNIHPGSVDFYKTQAEFKPLRLQDILNEYKYGDATKGIKDGVYNDVIVGVTDGYKSV